MLMAENPSTGPMPLADDTHRTRRQGSPYTLVLNKTDALFAREHEARIRDETDLGWLAAEWNPGA